MIRRIFTPKCGGWAAAAVLLVVALWGGLVPLVQAELNWRALQQRGTLRVGIDPGVAPFSYYDAAGWNGFDADVAHALAERLHLPLQSDPVGYDSMYDALQTHRVDIVISAVVPDPARTADFAFSTTYFDAGPRLVTALPAATMPELTGRRIAVSLGSEADRVVRYWERRVPHLQRIEVTSDLEALQAVQNNNADAALVDVLTPQLNGPWCGALPCNRISIAPRPLVVAMRRSDAALLRQVNEALEMMRADDTLSQMETKWIWP